LAQKNMSSKGYCCKAELTSTPYHVKQAMKKTLDFYITLCQSL